MSNISIKKSKLVRKQIYLPADIYNELSIEALKNKKSTAELIREILINNRKKNSKVNNNLLSLAGSFKGKSDKNSAINHNDIYKI